jgi:DNA-binding NarL/FixJ family response regulator
MMRLGLVHYLSQESDLAVCGEAANAAGALAVIEKTRPDLVVLDITLEGRSGLDLLQELHARFPNSLVLIHSMHDEMMYAERVFAAGARGYLMKQEGGDSLLAAVRQVLGGEMYVSLRLRKQGGKTFGHQGESQTQTPISRLTAREFEVFQMIGRGNNNREVARRLHISIKTVDVHREHIKAKLNLKSSTALNLMAVRWVSEAMK